MLDISRSERYFILTLLFFGLFFTGLSYYKKVSHTEIRTVSIDEPRHLININTADANQLERLPGIGPVLAAEIVAYRERTGGFKRPEEIKEIKGIGDKKFERLKDLIIISE